MANSVTVVWPTVGGPEEISVVKTPVVSSVIPLVVPNPVTVV